MSPRTCNYIQVSTFYGRYLTDYTCRYVLKTSNIVELLFFKRKPEEVQQFASVASDESIHVLDIHYHDTYTRSCDQIMNDHQILVSLMPELFMTQLLHVTFLECCKFL
jgi:hypothetical protein